MSSERTVDYIVDKAGHKYIFRYVDEPGGAMGILDAAIRYAGDPEFNLDYQDVIALCCRGLSRILGELVTLIGDEKGQVSNADAKKLCSPIMRLLETGRKISKA